MPIGTRKELLEVRKLENDLKERLFDRLLRIAGLVVQLVLGVIMAAIAAFGIGAFQIPQMELARQKAIWDGNVEVLKMYFGLSKSEKDSPEALEMLMGMLDKKSNLRDIFIHILKSSRDKRVFDCIELRARLVEVMSEYERLEAPPRREPPTVDGSIHASSDVQLARQRASVNELQARLKRDCPPSGGGERD